jgi:hypothetical protein
MNTMEEVKQSKKAYLTPEDIAPILRCSRYSLTLQAREDPKKLGFPVIVIGTRTRIPRVGFINFMEGKECLL